MGGSVALVFRNTVCLNAFPKEVLNGIAVDVVQCGAVVGDVVPRAAHLFENELLESWAAQFLQRAAGAIVVLAPVVDGDVAGLCHHLNIGKPVLFVQVHIHHDAHCGAYLVGDVLQQPFHILQPNHLMVVIHTEVYHPALCIGVPANPFQIVIVPVAFVLNILAFLYYYRIFYRALQFYRFGFHYLSSFS